MEKDVLLRFFDLKCKTYDKCPAQGDLLDVHVQKERIATTPSRISAEHRHNHNCAVWPPLASGHNAPVLHLQSCQSVII